MIHLILSREYPPAEYPPGGIGSYVMNIARLLADRGETVHVIGQRWGGAPLAREERCEGRLIIHRIAADEVPAGEGSGWSHREMAGLKGTVFPEQWFSWSAASLAERLVQTEAIDVIEGQEWEAPLYYFLLRRSLGLGPRRHPPVIVHLHSPTELIHQYNGAPTTAPSFATMKRMEAFCIANADARLCPSRYLARQAGELFKFPADQVKVIPLPVGFTTALDRSDDVWRTGSICFVGRIEPRKGVIEWFEAARRVAEENESVHFDFVGGDYWSIQETLQRRLTPKLLPRFRFHGSKPRDELPQFLAGAMAGVVPSRWENFPNVCIEAMSSGLPVIATRLGGMVELIEDGHTGWLSADTGIAGMVDGLADALRRCLATAPRDRARMGAQAATTIRETCNNDRVAEEHVRFRKEVAERGTATRAVPSRARPGRGAGVILRAECPTDLTSCAASLSSQTVAPKRVILVCASKPRDTHHITALLPDATIVVSPLERGTAAWNRGVAECAGDDLDFFLFLDEHDVLSSDCIARASAALAYRGDIGIVSYWVDGERPAIAPSPAASYQVVENDVRTASAFRAAALRPEPFRLGLHRGYDVWEIANAILADGWSAVTYPAMLAQRDAPQQNVVDWPETTALRAMRAMVLEPLCKNNSLAMELIDAFLPIPEARSTAPPRSAPPPASWSRTELTLYYVQRAVFRPIASIGAAFRIVRSRVVQFGRRRSDRGASS